MKRTIVLSVLKYTIDNKYTSYIEMQWNAMKVETSWNYT